MMRKGLLIALATLGLVVAGCGLAEDEVVLGANVAGEIVIDMDEFSFGTDRIEVTAGQTVTFVLVNSGENEHEFMIGRDLVKTELGYPNGFVHDFFEDVTPVVEPPEAGMEMGDMDMGGGMAMDGEMSDEEMGEMDGEMSDEEMAEMDGEMSDEEMGEMGDDDVHPGFMVQRRPGEVARLTVTIPADAVGVWDVGCFRGRGAHWDAGMRTTLLVQAA